VTRRDRLALVPIAFGVLAIGGCYKPVFPPNQPRTQFETYDRMRQRYVPLEEPDVFGTPQPALRARLGQQQ
jgi:hypothetical protein